MKRTHLLKLGGSLLGVVFALLISEVALRIGGPDINRHPDWKHSPDLGWTIDPGGSRMDEVLPTGFRHRTRAIPKPDNVRRLLILGDSFSLGASLPYSSTFSGVLENLLNEGGNRWQVVNLSVDDWGPAQQLIALEEQGLSYDPDVVVLQVFPFNDFCNSLPILSYTCSFQDYHRPYLMPDGGRLRVTSLRPWRTWGRDHLRLFGLVENFLDVRWADPLRYIDLQPGDSPDPDSKGRTFFLETSRQVGLDYEGVFYSLVPEDNLPPALKDGWRVTESIYTRMKALLDERSIPALSVVIPFSWTFHPRWETFEETTTAPVVRTHATEKAETILRRLNVTTISGRARIEAGEEQPAAYFISEDDGHLGPYGHAQVAAWIAEELEQLGVSDR